MNSQPASAANMAKMGVTDAGEKFIQNGIISSSLSLETDRVTKIISPVSQPIKTITALKTGAPHSRAITRPAARLNPISGRRETVRVG